MPTWVDKILNSQSVQLGLAAVAFLIALMLVIIIARMLMGGRLRMPGGRARQARLGIVDAFDLDRQRQLIIVRRDNTEHLIMIGGPNDVVIESEILRVEARDLRDNRRDKVFDAPPDARIPARIGVPGSDIQVAGEPTPARPDDPVLPLNLPPEAPSFDGPALVADQVRSAPLVETPGPRAPTFPLPPRRPTPPVLERRPPPPLPDRVSRTDDLPSPPPKAATETSSPAPIPQAPTPPSPVSQSAAALPDPASRQVPPRPSVLKPLPPRPPIRPLKRITPQADTAPTAVPQPTLNRPAAPVLPSSPEAVSAPDSTAPQLGPVPPRPQALQPAKPPVRAPEPPSPAEPTASVAAAPEADALESLEEEMAKLLGRG